MGIKKDNLLIKNQEIAKEWDYEKNEGKNIENYSSGSHEKVWWKCKENNDHTWESRIECRTRRKQGCPYCSGRRATKENNLEVCNKEIMLHWSYSKNEKPPKFYTPTSAKKVWWKCLKCHCEYDMSISNKVKGTGCPYCKGKRANKHNNLKFNFPNLAEEWDYEKNSFRPSEVTEGSGKRVHWVCSKNSEHKWEAVIYSRVKGNGCPYCANKKIEDCSSLLFLFPDIAEEWDYEKNKIKPSEVSPNSGIKIWWKCKLNHSWRTNVYHRKKTGCPYCANKKILKGYNDLLTLKPEIGKMLKNKEDAYKVGIGSLKKMQWECSYCKYDNIYKSPHKVISNGLNCPRCSLRRSYPERAMLNLLNSLNVKFFSEKTFKWNKGKRYDFYLPDHNIIIETHGAQHYKETNIWGELENIQENDRAKKEKALENGICEYIEINCEQSRITHFRKNVSNSRLSEIFNIKGIVWEDIDSLSKEPVTYMIKKDHKNGNSIQNISYKYGYTENKIEDILNKELKEVINQSKSESNV